MQQDGTFALTKGWLKNLAKSVITAVCVIGGSVLLGAAGVAAVVGSAELFFGATGTIGGSFLANWINSLF
ncbi:hypothetical protein FACS1894156_7440 [Bacteroidia bacterium]|nr:hypothetical protein FACS1894156_7440 [Bacteroidia bacterium]